VSNTQYSYSIGDTVSLGCTAIDNIDGEVTCSYSGTVDSNTLGTYDITYTAEDSSGNIATLVVTYTINEANDYLLMDLFEYYDDAEGLSGVNLEVALRGIISDYTYVSYDAARYILDETDADPNQSGNVILVYTQYSVTGEWYCPTTADCNWNREHVWPQSLLDYDTTMSADLHNLKPADSGENSSRSNKYYDWVTSSSTYEPPDDVKGDIARILFYMMVRYEILDLVDTVPSTYEMALLSVLLEWHELDPVDDFESNRNDVIYSYQNNRNPFIDYEHFAELIWEDHPYYSSN